MTIIRCTAILAVFALGACTSEPDPVASPATPDQQPTGRLEVRGEIESIAEHAVVSGSRGSRYGGGWWFRLTDESTGYVVSFQNIPDRVQPGEYPLVKLESMPVEWDPATFELPLSVVFGQKSESGGLDRTWDSGLTGTLTVEAVENGKMSGRFELSASSSSFASDNIRVRGSFRNVEVPAAPQPYDLPSGGASTPAPG